MVRREEREEREERRGERGEREKKKKKKRMKASYCILRFIKTTQDSSSLVVKSHRAPSGGAVV
jgi:hypothetical protein